MIRQSLSSAIRSVSSLAINLGATEGAAASSSTTTTFGRVNNLLSILPTASLRVRSLLQKPTAAVNETDTVQAAVSKMVSEDVGTLAVLSKQGKVVGAFSERNVLKIDGDLENVKVGEVFEKDSMVTIHPHMTVAHHSILETLENTNGKQLPVACQNSGEFLGLMFVSDVLRAMTGECSFIRVMHDEYVGSVPIHDG